MHSRAGPTPRSARSSTRVSDASRTAGGIRITRNGDGSPMDVIFPGIYSYNIYLFMKFGKKKIVVNLILGFIELKLWVLLMQFVFLYLYVYFCVDLCM